MAKLNFSVKTQSQEGDLAVERNTVGLCLPSVAELLGLSFTGVTIQG